MTLQQFEKGLKAACPYVYHLAAPPGATRYVVWHEYSASSIFADNANLIDLPRVQLDIVSNRRNDPIEAAICTALQDMELPYSIESKGYDPEYNACRMILQVVVS